MNKVPFTPKGYLKSGKALKLPVYKFYVTEDWRKYQKFNLLFSRQHINGNITFSLCLVDLLCIGIKNVLYEVNVPFYVFEDYLSKLKLDTSQKIVEISHHLAHNMVYAALEYGEENGIAPHEDFRWASLIIGPDSDDIPLIDDIPFGENGMPLLEVDHLDPKLPYYLSQLRKTRGEGNFKVVIGDMDPYGEDYEEEETEDDLDPFEEAAAVISSWDEKDWEEYLTMNEEPDDFSMDDFLELNQVMQAIYQKHLWPKLSQELPLDKIRCVEKIELTGEPIDAGYGNIYPRDLDDEIYDISQLIADTKADKHQVKKSISQLDRLISSYPNVPLFYNLKYNCLIRMDNEKEASKVILATMKRFPDYLYAKLDLIQHQLAAGTEVDLNEFFGEARNLKSIYPSRQIFHLSEFTKFIDTMVRYHLHKGEISEAYAYYEELNKTDFNLQLMPETFIDFQKCCANESSGLLDKIGNDKALRQELIHDVVNN